MEPEEHRQMLQQVQKLEVTLVRDHPRTGAEKPSSLWDSGSPLCPSRSQYFV